MFEGIVSANSINFLLVFLEGILSFFSPCVIPLIPIYMSYLAGNAKQESPDGIVTYERKKVFFHTVFFVIGISFAFFILGLSFSALGTFFNTNKVIFSRIGGIIIILLGLVQVGFLDFGFLKGEKRFHLKMNLNKMNPLVAFVMGFTFSFAWTRCVGPALSSVLILASSAKDATTGNLLVLVYALGFILPFLALGLFTSQVLNFIQSKRNLIKYTIKAGGVILIIIGIMTFTGWLNTVTGYLNSATSSNSSLNNNQENKGQVDSPSSDTSQEGGAKDASEDTSGENSEEASESIPAFDFSLTDQYGNTHKLSDYKGKVVFLNFWATWCPPCRIEMPHIEELYEEYNKNSEDVIILGVASPKTKENPNTQEKDTEGVKAFLDENNFTFPVVFDETGDVFSAYYVNALPTTYMIDKEGNIFGYVSGALTKDMMKNIINQTIENKK